MQKKQPSQIASFRLFLYITVTLLSALLVSACSETSIPGSAVQQLQYLISGSPTFTPTPSPTPTVTPLPTATFTPTLPPTETPLPTPTVDPANPHGWNWHEAGEPVHAPILLYHHVDAEPNDIPYFITVELFTQQMDWLVQNGYTSITGTQLANALIHGEYLPEKPVLITFDDGFADIYTTAFPIMRDRGLIGNYYIVGRYLRDEVSSGVPYLQGVAIPQVQALVNAGWEIGSHSMTHQNLDQGGDLNYEIGESKSSLSQRLGVPINVFCFPYGAAYTRPGIFQKVSDFGYLAGMGLGKSNTHGLNSLFYFSRVEIPNGTTLEQFQEKVLAP